MNDVRTPVIDLVHFNDIIFSSAIPCHFVRLLKFERNTAFARCVFMDNFVSHIMSIPQNVDRTDTMNSNIIFIANNSKKNEMNYFF
jgi:hypothetical protein